MNVNSFRSVKAGLASLALGVGLVASVPARAQDAEFGCKVLLCAAATNPGWSGIPYCVPVMNQLFSILNSGGSWPSCPQGDASGLTVEPYKACAAPNQNYSIDGFSGSGCSGARCNNGTVGIPDGAGGYTVPTGRYASSIPVTATPYGPFCANPQFVQCFSGKAGNGCALTSGSLTPAPANPNPDCVTISPQGGNPFQFCFNLQGG